MHLVLLRILGLASGSAALVTRMRLRLLVPSLRSWSRLLCNHWSCSSSRSSSGWASLAYTCPSTRLSTQNRLIFPSLSREQSYQVFSFPCFINSTIKFSHMFIKYLHPCNVSCLLFVGCFSEALAFRFHVGNLLRVKGVELLWVLCVSRVSPNTSFPFCCSCAETDMRSYCHRSASPSPALWGLGCIKGEFPSGFI